MRERGQERERTICKGVSFTYQDGKGDMTPSIDEI